MYDWKKFGGLQLFFLLSTPPVPPSPSVLWFPLSVMPSSCAQFYFVGLKVVSLPVSSGRIASSADHDLVVRRILIIFRGNFSS